MAEPSSTPRSDAAAAEAARAMLLVARDLEDRTAQLEHLARLVELGLDNAQPGVARGWMRVARTIIDTGFGGAVIRARLGQLGDRLDREARGVEAIEPDLPAPTPRASAAEEAARLEVMQATLAAAEARAAAARAEAAQAIAEMEAGIAALEPPVDAPAAGPMAEAGPIEPLHNAPLSACPVSLRYVLDEGPPTPDGVLWLTETPLDLRTTGGAVFSWLLLLLAVVFFVIAIQASHSDSMLNGAIGLVLSSFLGSWALMRYARGAAARGAQNRMAEGRYKLGLYLTPAALVYRMPQHLTIIHRADVQPSRIDSQYDSETKQTEQTLVITGQGPSGPVELRLGRGLSGGPGPARTHIERWRGA